MEAPRYGTPKQMKDQWSINNRKIILFNGIYNRLHVVGRSEADDAMLVESAKEL